jgi:hypothetical protein
MIRRLLRRDEREWHAGGMPPSDHEAVAANERSFTGQYLRETLAKAPVRNESVALAKPRKRAKRASEDQPDLIAAK